jgi:hypothetical protein
LPCDIDNGILQAAFVDKKFNMDLDFTSEKDSNSQWKQLRASLGRIICNFNLKAVAGLLCGFAKLEPPSCIKGLLIYMHLTQIWILHFQKSDPDSE